MQRHQYEITNLIPDSSYYVQVQAMSINGRRRLKSEKYSILYNTTIVPTQSFEGLKCGKEQQQQLTRSDSLGNSLTTTSDERSFSKKYSLNDASLSDTPSMSSLAMKNGTYTTKSTDKFDVKYRLNRKLGMLVVISGFHPKEEK